MSALSLYRSAIQFGINLVVVAFVDPAAYGLVVFTTPFIIFVSMMTDMGLSSAIIRNPELTPRQIGAAFMFTLVAGCAFAALLMLASWPLESVTHMAGLSGVMIGMSLSLILLIGGGVPRALLERELRYGAVATTEAASVFCAAACAVGLAFAGAGIWSLVAYNLIANALRLGLYLRHSWRQLRPNRDFAGLKPLFSFGIWVFASNTLNFFARNGDNLLIGAFLGSAAVGLYGLAYQFMILPLMAITWPVSGVLMATLSREGLNSERATQTIIGVIGLTATIVFPAMAYMTFGLRFPAETVLSSQWSEVLDILKWLAPVGALQAIAAYNGAILLVAGRAQTQFWYSVFNSVATIATFVIALPFGLHVLVTAYACVAIVLSCGFLVLIVTLTKLTLWNLIAALAPAIAATALALALAATAGLVSPGGLAAWLAETAAFAVGALAVYALVHRRIFGFLSSIRA